MTKGEKSGAIGQIDKGVADPTEKTVR